MLHCMFWTFSSAVSGGCPSLKCTLENFNSALLHCKYQQFLTSFFKRGVALWSNNNSVQMGLLFACSFLLLIPSLQFFEVV
jgi:hypothetical protein